MIRDILAYEASKLPLHQLASHLTVMRMVHPVKDGWIVLTSL